jgi:hypothetical protein
MQYSGECAHVLENDDSMVTACAFSGDSFLLATGITESYGSESLMSLRIASNYFCILLSFKMTLESSVSTLNLQFVSLAMGHILRKFSEVITRQTYIEEMPDIEHPD